MNQNNPPRDAEDVIAGIIILDPSGTPFTNQAGGMCCTHPWAVGHYWSFGDVEGPMRRRAEAFSDATHDLLCWKSGDEINADVVAAALATHFPFLQLDRARMGECQEAWIPVIGGVLVYENCD